MGFGTIKSPVEMLIQGRLGSGERTVGTSVTIEREWLP